MDEMGWNALHELVGQFGWGWVLIGGAGFLILSRFNILQRIFAERHKTHTDEREQLSEDIQQFIETLQKDNAQQRALVIDYGRRIEELQERVNKLVDAITLSERGNSRLRHALNNVLMWAAGLRRRLRRDGIEIPPFPLDDLLALDPELGKKMQEIFEEVDGMPKLIEDGSRD